MSSSPTLFLFIGIVMLSFLLLTMKRIHAKSCAAPRNGKLARLRERLKSSEWRRYGMVVLAGKLIGVSALVGATYFFNPDLLGFKVFAADPVLKGQ